MSGISVLLLLTQNLIFLLIKSVNYRLFILKFVKKKFKKLIKFTLFIYIYSNKFWSTSRRSFNLFILIHTNKLLQNMQKVCD